MRRVTREKRLSEGEPFNPEKRGTWHGSSRDLVVNGRIDEECIVITLDGERDGWAIVNPLDVPRDKHARESSLFAFSFGAFGSKCLVWAAPDHIDDALELAAEWLSEYAPGFFHEVESEADEVDMTYTESGWIPSWEWGVDELMMGPLFEAARAESEKAFQKEYGDKYDEIEPNRSRSQRRNGGRYRTFPVAAAAYRKSDPKSFLTHSCEVDAQGFPTAVLCKRVKLASIMDDLEQASDDEPTCPACATAMSRMGGGGGGTAAKGQILSALDKLQAKAGREYVTLADLHDAVGGSMESFHERVNELRRDWVVSCSPSEGRHGQGPSAREMRAAIIEDRSTSGIGHTKDLVYIRRRETDDDDLEPNRSRGRALRRNGMGGGLHMDRALLKQFVEMAAESSELPNWKDAEINEEVIDQAEAYDLALSNALTELVRKYPPKNGATAEDLWYAEAPYLVLMTLRGEGVGIWDGDWDQFYSNTDAAQSFLTKKLSSFATGYGSGSLEGAFLNAAFESCGGGD